MNEEIGVKEKVLYVDGMHCSSCEILIEKKILKKDHVESVDASLGSNEVRIFYKKGSYIDVDALNEEFSAMGYSFSKHPLQKVSRKFFSRDQNGKLIFDKEKAKKYRNIAFIVFGFLLVFYIFEKMQFGRFVSVDSNSTLFAFFLLGVVASISSCAALIGGLLLSLTKQWHEIYLDPDDHKERKIPHVLFHVGRLVSFFLLGGILGAIGGKVSFSNTTVYAIIVILVSLVMFILALQMLDVAWARKFQFRLPKFITRAAANEKATRGKHVPFMTGALTFFLPCGFTLIAQGVALTSQSFWKAGFIMLFFALGTLPVLLGISATGLKMTQKPHKTAKFSTVAGIIVLFFALYNINGQFNVLGWPSLSDISFGSGKSVAVACDSRYATCLNAQGEQEVKIIAQSFEYLPNGPTVFQAGVPTKIVVDDRGVLGCGKFIAARGLFDNFFPLRTGMNVIDIGKPRAGSYKLTCSMGMVPPVTLTFQ